MPSILLEDTVVAMSEEPRGTCGTERKVSEWPCSFNNRKCLRRLAVVRERR